MEISTGTQVGLGIAGFLSYVIGAVVTLLFLYTAWRAMRAHERIAAALERQSAPKA
ncbi:MAG: hypothetical protein ACKVWV_09385 [Planctomycetota bacterium]